ncbi:MAG: hypothetical protein QG618_2107 [Thermodesulfobacteriota bacterium]|nr:hypothetical protein [Thermodesulfobacteriota bacterium]
MPEVQTELNETIAWAEKNPPGNSDIEQLAARIK